MTTTLAPDLLERAEMDDLKQLLEAYRKGERGLPTYEELAAIAYAEERRVIEMGESK